MSLGALLQSLGHPELPLPFPLKKVFTRIHGTLENPYHSQVIRLQDQDQCTQRTLDNYNMMSTIFATQEFRIRRLVSRNCLRTHPGGTTVFLSELNHYLAVPREISLIDRVLLNKAGAILSGVFLGSLGRSLSSPSTSTPSTGRPGTGTLEDHTQ